MKGCKSISRPARWRSLRHAEHGSEKAVDNALRDFELSGIGLPKENSSVTAKLLPVFLNWAISTEQRPRCDDGLDQTRYRRSGAAGMPESALAAAKAQAEAKELKVIC